MISWPSKQLLNVFSVRANCKLLSCHCRSCSCNEARISKQAIAGAAMQVLSAIAMASRAAHLSRMQA
jgi:hypothetical protein